jgi:hypothetical protein
MIPSIADMILYLKTLKTPPKKPLRYDKHFQQSSRIQKSVAFLYTDNEQGRKSGKQFHS